MPTSNMKMTSLIASTDAKQREDFSEVMKQVLGAMATLDMRLRALAKDVDKLRSDVAALRSDG